MGAPTMPAPVDNSLFDGRIEFPATSVFNAPVMNSRATGSFDFTYAGNPYNSYRLNDTAVKDGQRAFVMFELRAEDIKELAGNNVTGVTIASPIIPENENNSTPYKLKGRFFCSYTGTAEDYVQDFEFTPELYSFTSVELKEPIEIKGDEQKMYFGYSLVVTETPKAYYVVTDFTPNDNSNTMFAGADEGKFPESFYSVGEAIGSLCMSITVTGDNLPENKASVVAVNPPTNLPINGDGAEIELTVRNRAANSISSVEVTVKVPDMPDIVETLTFRKPLEYNQEGNLIVKGLKAKEPGYPTISVAITKVNGEAVKDAAYEVSIPAFDEGFTANIVLEDATGTWCGWCPRGLEILEFMKEEYPDRAIGIGVHSSDPMAIESYQPFLAAYISGFPTILANRTYVLSVPSSYSEICNYLKDFVSTKFNAPSYAKVELAGETSADRTKAEMVAKTTFAINSDVKHYLSFVIVEDQVGPYEQSNYYSMYGTAMNGWEQKGDKVAMLFDDVARYYDKFPGIEGSLPTSVKAGDVCEYKISLPLNKVVEGNNYRVIAMLTNSENGRIINACQLNMDKDNSGIASIAEDSNVTFAGGNGCVLVNGADNCSVYTISGCKVANNNLPAGLYIAVANGKTAKVLVK